MKKYGMRFYPRKILDAFLRARAICSSFPLTASLTMSAENGVSGSDESSFTFEQFVALHKAQLQSSGITELFWQTLFIKLKNEVIGFRDIGSVHRSLYLSPK